MVSYELNFNNTCYFVTKTLWLLTVFQYYAIFLAFYLCILIILYFFIFICKNSHIIIYSLNLHSGLLSHGQNDIIVIGATNRPRDVDKAILRRMPCRFYVPMPVRVIYIHSKSFHYYFFMLSKEAGSLKQCQPKDFLPVY